MTNLGRHTGRRNQSGPPMYDIRTDSRQFGSGRLAYIATDPSDRNTIRAMSAIHFLLLLCCACNCFAAGAGERFNHTGGQQARSGGYPKFPFPVLQSCGSRLIPWRPQREPRIVGGEVPPYGAVPWQVDIRNDLGNHHCGGTIISNRLVLTAAHCWADGLRASTGTHGPHTPYEQNMRVLKGVLHPEFRKNGPYSNDIAVLLLEEPGFRFNPVVQAACLPEESPTPGTWCEVSGWGAIDPMDPERLSPILRSAAVPLISLDTCRKDGIYGGRQQAILDTMLCAGRLKGGVDACGGDSGGPLVCESNGRVQLAGIVSWGDGCAKKDRPGVYTRISSYTEWIRKMAEDLNINLD